MAQKGLFPNDDYYYYKDLLHTPRYFNKINVLRKKLWEIKKHVKVFSSLDLVLVQLEPLSSTDLLKVQEAFLLHVNCST
jgi:hypothetical protein